MGLGVVVQRSTSITLDDKESRLITNQSTLDFQLIVQIALAMKDFDQNTE